MPSAQYCYRGFVRPHPLLQNDEAEQNLVMVMPACGMLLEKLTYCTRFKILINAGATLLKGLDHLAVESPAEPVIHYSAVKPSFPALYDRFRKETPAQFFV